MKFTGSSRFLRLNSELIKSYLGRIQNIDAEQIKQPWSERSWQELSEAHDQYELFILEDNELMAFALYSLHNTPQAHLLKIAVCHSKKGQGYGLELLTLSQKYLVENKEIEDIYLEVSIENIRAIKFYKEFGFHEIHCKKQFYSDGCDALIMQLKAK